MYCAFEETVLNLDELEKLAKAATPGPWVANDNYVINGTGGAMLVGSDNSKFISAANPDAVLKLIAVAKAADILLSDLSLKNKDQLAEKLNALEALDWEG